MDALKLIAEGNYITASKDLIFALGPDAAIIYGALASKHLLNKTYNTLKHGGMFYCTHETLAIDTGLKRHRQNQALKVLKKEGLVYTYLKDLPAKRYFYLDTSNLKKKIAEYKKFKVDLNTIQLKEQDCKYY